MYIGQISKLTAASPKAIRHYESLGLLGQVARAGAYRVYSEREVGQIRLIRQAQAMGFRLSELRSVLDGRSSEPDWLGLAEQIDRKRADIRQEIERLRSLDLHLGQINVEIRACLAHAGGDEAGRNQCDPALDAIADAVA